MATPRMRLTNTKTYVLVLSWLLSQEDRLRRSGERCRKYNVIHHTVLAYWGTRRRNSRNELGNSRNQIVGNGK
ncbi:hypothetical protein MMC28_009671, partial [Mycoblastus sanguinarius]|nr:hypothetical protein [Mycoblastus sanguinarius]